MEGVSYAVYIGRACESQDPSLNFKKKVCESALAFPRAPGLFLEENSREDKGGKLRHQQHSR